jgi:hypothetical protein
VNRSSCRHVVRLRSAALSLKGNRPMCLVPKNRDELQSWSTDCSALSRKVVRTLSRKVEPAIANMHVLSLYIVEYTASYVDNVI